MLSSSLNRREMAVYAPARKLHADVAVASDRLCHCSTEPKECLAACCANVAV